MRKGKGKSLEELLGEWLSKLIARIEQEQQERKEEESA